MSNISAKVIAKSVSPQGKELVTFELEYPRIIHSELMTHRLFSRNAASSRAIPVKTLIEMVRQEPAMPHRFGANQPGMQDKGGEHDGMVPISQDGGSTYYFTGREAWTLAADSACDFAEALAEAGYHKQVANRLLEPFQRMKTVLTATEYENFWWLRVDADADPTIEALAQDMYRAYTEAEAELLQPGEWHTPYVNHVRYDDGELLYFVEGDRDEYEMVFLTVEEAKSISSSCCAQVSYRRLNSTKDKALDIYGRLLSGQKVHASPFEHQGSPMEETVEEYAELYSGDCFINVHWMLDSWQEGITHFTRDGKFWSGNFCGWIQHRQLLDNHTKW